MLCIGLVYGGWLGLRTIQATLRPLGRLNAAMDKIAHGELNSRILIKRDDEIGTALRNIQAMQAKLGFDREVQIETERRINAERRAEMQKLAYDFEGAVGEIINTVSSASTELEALGRHADDHRGTRPGPDPDGRRSLRTKRPPMCSRWRRRPRR